MAFNAYDARHDLLSSPAWHWRADRLAADMVEGPLNILEDVVELLKDVPSDISHASHPMLPPVRTYTQR